jgi:hypothetical protein
MAGLVLEGDAFRECPIVVGNALGGVALQPPVDDGAKCFEIGRVDQFAGPAQIVHQSSPALVEV